MASMHSTLRQPRSQIMASRFLVPDVPVRLNVNGKEDTIEIEPRTTLAEALRIQMGMTGTKIICDRGTCSGCTVWLDKMPVNSCTMLAVDAIGHQVTTIEGLSADGSLHPLQAAFVKHDALQCGFCTPGMVMSCAALLESESQPLRAGCAPRHCRQSLPLWHVSQNLHRYSRGGGQQSQGLRRSIMKIRTNEDSLIEDLMLKGALLQEAPNEAASVEKKTVKMPVGVPGYTLQDESRDVPVTEPPVWPINKDLKYVGQPIERWDGQAKVSGRARYTADVQLPGMLYAKFVNASVPHAKVVSVDTSAAERYPGVKGVHVIQHVLGGAVLIDPALEQVKYPVVRYAGQPIAAVAAVTPYAAEEAADLVKVQYDAMPFVVDSTRRAQRMLRWCFPAKPTRQGLPAVVVVPATFHKPATSTGHRSRSRAISIRASRTRTSSSRALHHSGADALGARNTRRSCRLEARHAYRVGFHAGHGERARGTGGLLQYPDVAGARDHRVMGGGFGAKFGAGNHGVVAAALSKKTGAPVRLMLDREEEHLSVGNRPSSDQLLRIGAKKDGEITAIHLVSYGTAGCGTGAGCSGPASNLYKYATLHTEENDVFINAGPGAAMRAPGHPQGAFALEQTMDELAVKLNMEPIDLRDKTDEHPVRRVERQIVRESDLWKSRNPRAGADTGPVKRGVGLAQSVWYRFVSMNSSAEVRVHKDGSLEVLSSVQDIGSGIKTVMAQILSEQFGVPPAQIAVKIGDTNYPAGPNSGGSVTTLSLTPAVRDAAWQASQKFLADIAPTLGATQTILCWSTARFAASRARCSR